MRLLTLSAFTLVAGSLAAAADFTYVSGSLSILTPNSGGTLLYSTGKQIELKTPLHKVAIPFATISKAELGEVHTPTPEPVYKIWSLRKRFANKGETQELTVTFKDDTGSEQTVILELSRQDAWATLVAIQGQNETVPGANGQWWGDRMWKTSHNSAQWSSK